MPVGARCSGSRAAGGRLLWGCGRTEGVHVFPDVRTIEGVRGEIRTRALANPYGFGVDRVELRSQVRSDSYALGGVTRADFAVDPGGPPVRRSARLPANRTLAPTWSQSV